MYEFHHTIWANPKYLIHMPSSWRVFCFCRYSVRLTLSRGWTKAVWFLKLCLLKLNDETVARLSWIIQGKRDDNTAIDEPLSPCDKVKHWSKNNFPTWIMDMILPKRFILFKLSPRVRVIENLSCLIVTFRAAASHFSTHSGSILLLFLTGAPSADSSFRFHSALASRYCLVSRNSLPICRVAIFCE